MSINLQIIPSFGLWLSGLKTRPHKSSLQIVIAPLNSFVVGRALSEKVAMDLPTVRGVVVESPHDLSSYAAFTRHNAIEKLIAWGKACGVMSKDSVSFQISEQGHIRCVANRFIPAHKHILHVPFMFDLSFTTLKAEIHSDKTWPAWTDLKASIKTFEQNFRWSPFNYDHKDYFSNNVLLAVSMLGVLRKLEVESPEVIQNSFILQTFQHYWKAVREDVGNVLFDWSPAELACLEGSSFNDCLADARRFGEEMFEHVVQPFTLQHQDIFGDGISLSLYLKVNSIILTQSFGSGKKKKSSLLPIIDLVNGKPNDMHNCTLENCAIQKEINGEFIKFHVLETFCDIYAGDEIILEYAQVGNGEYLLNYNHIPMDPEVIMNNQKTEIYLDLSEFLETELLRMHPNAPAIRKMKREHVYGFFNLPQHIPITMEDLFSSEYSCIPSIRQVLIFIQFDEADAAKAIKTSRIKSQLNPHQLHYLFHLFLKFIECSLQKPKLDLFHALLGKPCPEAVRVLMTPPSESVISSSSTATTIINSSSEASDRPASSSSSSSSSAVTTAASSSASAVSSSCNSTEPHTAGMGLTTNMKSAVFLQMSERLVVEVMINRFINLFPENFHDLGYSIMRDHLVSTEINSILEELCRPLIAARTTQCLVCGSSQNVSKCSRCRLAFYCSAACQKEHWPFHRGVCKPHSSK